MTPQTLWQQLSEAGLTNGMDQPEGLDAVVERPWYIRLLYGFSGWLASWFLLGFLAMGLFELFDDEWAMGVVGLLLSVPAFVAYRKGTDSDFWQQALLVFSLAGQLCVALALFEGLGFNKESPLIILAAYQAALYVLMNDHLHRLLSAMFAFAAAYYAFADHAFLPLLTVILSGCFVALWMNQDAWGRKWAYFDPLSVALSVVLLVTSSTQLHGVRGRWWFSPVVEEPPMLSVMQLGSQLLTAMIVLYLLFLILKEIEGDFQANVTQKAIAVILVLVMSFYVSGLAAALVVLLVGVARRNLWLQGLGIMACLGFVTWFYYDLSGSLLWKSASLVALGVLFLLLFRALKPDAEPVGIKTNRSSSASAQTKVALLAVVLCFFSINWAIWQKERLLSEGKSIFLALAPVDPRSIMQGDYMRLRFALSRTISQQQDQVDGDSGLVVVRTGDDGVAEFDDLYQGQVLEAGQMVLAFQKRGHDIQIGSGSFFFQEGQAKLFDTAAYGELVVDEKGHVLLKALRDKDLNLLGLNRLD